MFEQYFLSIVISSIVTYLVWIRSKKWLRKNIKSQIHSNSDKKLYWIFFTLTLIAHFALLVSLVFLIDLFNFVFK